MKTKDIDFKVLQELLRQIGIFVKDEPCGRHQSIYFLKSLDMEHGIGLKVYENSRRCHSAWCSFDRLKDDIFNWAGFFVYVGASDAHASQIALHQIFKENPYLGAKTFEEAMIRKDLLLLEGSNDGN